MQLYAVSHAVSYDVIMLVMAYFKANRLQTHVRWRSNLLALYMVCLVEVPESSKLRRVYSPVRNQDIVDSHKIENGLTLILSERVAYSLSAALSAISRRAILSVVQLICMTGKGHVRSPVACDCCNLIGSIRFWIEHTGSVQEYLDPLLPPSTE